MAFPYSAGDVVLADDLNYLKDGLDERVWSLNYTIVEDTPNPGTGGTITGTVDNVLDNSRSSSVYVKQEGNNASSTWTAVVDLGEVKEFDGYAVYTKASKGSYGDVSVTISISDDNSTYTTLFSFSPSGTTWETVDKITTGKFSARYFKFEIVCTENTSDTSYIAEAYLYLFTPIRLLSVW